MRISCTHTNMGSLSPAEMELQGEYFLGSLPTRRIIQRSTYLSFKQTAILNSSSRIILIGVKFLGKMPCPRCFICKDDICSMGTRSDMRACSKMCTYDDAQSHEMDAARRHIYELGYAVGGDAIDGILGEKSLVPTRVCTLTTLCFTLLKIFIRTHSLTSYMTSILTTTRSSWSIFCMSSNSVYGRPSSRT